MHLILFVVYQNMDRPVCNNDLRYYRDNLTYNKQSQGRKLNSQVVDLRLDGRKRTQESCAKSCHFCEAENRSYVLFFKFSKVTQKNGSLATMSSLAKDIIVYSFEKDIGGGRCLEAPWDRFFNIKGAQLHKLKRSNKCMEASKREVQLWIRANCETKQGHAVSGGSFQQNCLSCC